jgi:chaperone modulatory protein CbpM
VNDDRPGDPEGNVIGDEGSLSIEEVARACQVESQWVCELVAEGVLDPDGHGASAWRFRAADLRCALRIARLRRDFGASLDAVAVMLELLDEIEWLRTRLRRAGLDDDQGR